MIKRPFISRINVPDGVNLFFFLYHNDSLPNLNHWDRVRYQIVRRALLQLYRNPFKFRKNAVEREERVIPVPVPHTDGRPD